MNHAYERRFLATEFETRASGDKLTIEGYALKWNVRSQNLGGFRERVEVGATTKTIGEADIRALFNHDKNFVLGRNRSGTLRLAEDSQGLHYEIDGDMRQSYTRDLAIAMERGDVNQSSFGFRAIKDDWTLDEEDFPLRSLHEIALFDISPVTTPAYLDSTSGVRALERLCESRSLHGIDLSDVEAIKAAIRGDVEPDPAPDEERQETTLLLPPYDTAFDAAIRARLLGI